MAKSIVRLGKFFQPFLYLQFCCLDITFGGAPTHSFALFAKQLKKKLNIQII